MDRVYFAGDDRDRIPFIDCTPYFWRRRSIERAAGSLPHGEIQCRRDIRGKYTPVECMYTGYERRVIKVGTLFTLTFLLPLSLPHGRLLIIFTFAQIPLISHLPPSLFLSLFYLISLFVSALSLYTDHFLPHFIYTHLVSCTMLLVNSLTHPIVTRIKERIYSLIITIEMFVHILRMFC